MTIIPKAAVRLVYPDARCVEDRCEQWSIHTNKEAAGIPLSTANTQANAWRLAYSAVRDCFAHYQAYGVTITGRVEHVAAVKQALADSDLSA